MGSSGLPFTLPFATTLTMSFVGCARRFSASSLKYANSSMRERSSVSFADPPRWNSGSCGAMISLVQRKSRSQSSRGTPSISAITAIVIFAETSWTKSQRSVAAGLVEHLARDALDLRRERGRPRAA